MPIPVEMLKHQCTLLCAELETTRRDLRKAHQNIAKLIVMHRDGPSVLAALKAEHERLRLALISTTENSTAPVPAQALR